MATNNDVETAVLIRRTLNMTNLGDSTDDELDEITALTVMPTVTENGSIPDNQSLSQRIGLCQNMKELSVVNCTNLPTEISHCTLLSELRLFSNCGNGDDCRIELPEGIILPNLTKLCILGGGNWNTGDIITWLATSTPNLELNLPFINLTRDTVNQLMWELQNNVVFIEKFKHTLQSITFNNCNLNEDDAREIIVNITPLYSRLSVVNLQNNNIEGLKTIAAVVRETPPANNNLRGLILNGNPVSRHLNDPNSSDHAAMMCLLKYHTRLSVIRTTLTYSSLIDYRLMMNASGLRYLVDDGHGGTRRSGILPLVMDHAYNKREQDPTTLFNFLREGPFFKTHEL